MEVDFKFNNKILARDLIKCLERGGDVPKEKYGIRKGKKSIMHAYVNIFNSYFSLY